MCKSCGLKKIHARELCRNCYDKWLKENNPGYKQRQTSNSKKWHDKNPERLKEHAKRHRAQVGVSLSKTAKKYGLNVEEYVEVVSQPCGLCGTTERPRYMDHNHETGSRRGPLCHGCNLGVGFLENRGEDWAKSALDWMSR